MKNILILMLLIGAVLGGLWWSATLDASGPSVVSPNGLHWHPKLEIIVGSEAVIIPENIGLGAVHKPVHTHDDLPVIHLEFSGRVTEDDIRLGQFFANWGRDMHSFGKNMRMTVNGVENTEFENYVMKDADDITLYFD